MNSQDLFLHNVHLTFVIKKNFMFYIFFWLNKLYLNFDVLYNTYKSKTIMDKVYIFTTILAPCTFNTTKKTRVLYLIPVKSYNDLNTAYRAEKRAIYNTPTLLSCYLPQLGPETSFISIFDLYCNCDFQFSSLILSLKF